MSIETTFANAVAIKIIKYRVEHKLTQTALARKLDMQQPAIARLEAGDIEPTLHTLSRLARGLGIEFRIVVTSSGETTLLSDEGDEPTGWPKKISMQAIYRQLDEYAAEGDPEFDVEAGLARLQKAMASDRGEPESYTRRGNVP